MMGKLYTAGTTFAFVVQHVSIKQKLQLSDGTVLNEYNAKTKVMGSDFFTGF